MSFNYGCLQTHDTQGSSHKSFPQGWSTWLQEFLDDHPIPVTANPKHQQEGEFSPMGFFHRMLSKVVERLLNISDSLQRPRGPYGHSGSLAYKTDRISQLKEWLLALCRPYLYDGERGGPVDRMWDYCTAGLGSISR